MADAKAIIAQLAKNVYRLLPFTPIFHFIIFIIIRFYMPYSSVIKFATNLQHLLPVSGAAMEEKHSMANFSNCQYALCMKGI